MTFYHVESSGEWDAICSRDGALGLLQSEKQKGRVGLVGLTTHQRKLAAECAEENKLDLLMVRYNAAHRGAERNGKTQEELKHQTKEKKTRRGNTENQQYRWGQIK